MKFEHLIWIVLFLFYVVSIIIKRGRAAQKTSGKTAPKKLPEWKEKLNKFLSQVQQAAGQEKPLEDPGLILEELSFEEIEPAVEKPPAPKRKPLVPKRKPALVKAESKSPEPAFAAKKTRPNDLAFGIQDLRKAVIWSEILAPPLALRDKKESRM
jgi:hypothetical protein